MMTVDEYLASLPEGHALRRMPIAIAMPLAQREIDTLSSPEYLAKVQRDSDDAAAKNAIKADAFVQNFVAMTPAQVSAYVTANTANLGQVRALMAKMALMLSMLARLEYR
jgi:hypothetical protein